MPICNTHSHVIFMHVHARHTRAQDKGSVLVDGHPIEEYDVHHLRRHMAIVAQENVLFDRTIKENITYGLDPPPSDAEVVAACKRAGWLVIRRVRNTVGQASATGRGYGKEKSTFREFPIFEVFKNPDASS